MKTLTKLLIVLAVLVALIFPLAAFSVTRLALHAVPEQAARAQVAALEIMPLRLNTGDVALDTGGLTIGTLEFVFQSGPGDKLVLGGVYVLREGETLEGSLFVMGGTATLEQDSLVEGDVLLLGGSVNVSGTVEGDIVAIGGFADLSESAVVEGSVNAIGGHVTFTDRESIQGDVNTGLPGGPIIIPGPIEIPDMPNVNMVQPNLFGSWMGFVSGMLWWLLRAFMWAVLAVLAVLFVPRNTERTASVVVSQPLIAGGLGLLTAFIAPLLLLVIAITIIGIPVSLVGFLVLAVAWALGLIAIGTEIGKRLAAALNQEWALPVSAAIGTLILTLITNGVGQLIPCVGWMIGFLVGIVGLGAVLLTRFGSQVYPAAPMAVMPEPPAPPAPPVPPAPPTKVVEEPVLVEDQSVVEPENNDMDEDASVDLSVPDDEPSQE